MVRLNVQRYNTQCNDKGRKGSCGQEQTGIKKGEDMRESQRATEEVSQAHKEEGLGRKAHTGMSCLNKQGHTNTKWKVL